MPEDPKRDVVAEEEIREHSAAIASMASILTSALLMRRVYKEVGREDDAEGAKQAASAAVAAIEEHLAYFRELCK